MGLGNFLQGLAPAIDPNSQLAVAPLAMPQTTPLPNLPAPRERRSVLDTVGRLADVFARAGGADALYQPTLDARQDRELALADHARAADMDGLKRTLTEQQIGAGTTAAHTAQNEVLGRIAQATLAYPEERRADVFAALAQRAGITPDQTEGMTPELMQGAATAFTDKPDYGRQIAYDRSDPNNPRAYVVVNGRPQFLDGVTPALPTRQVDLGGGSGAVDPLTGRTVGRIIPRTERPGAAADRDARITVARDGNASRERIGDQVSSDRRYVADTRPAGRGATGGAAGKPSQAAVAAAARPLVRDLADAVTRLHRSGGMTNSLSSMARENVPGYERMTNSAGYSARQDLDRLTTQGISALLPLMGGLSLGGKNMDAAKELDTWKKAILSATDYPSAMRAINGFNARIRQMEATAPAAVPPRRTGTLTAPRRTVTPAPRGGGNGGWSIVSTR